MCAWKDNQGSIRKQYNRELEVYIQPSLSLYEFARMLSLNVQLSCILSAAQFESVPVSQHTAAEHFHELLESSGLRLIEPFVSHAELRTHICLLGNPRRQVLAAVLELGLG